MHILLFSVVIIAAFSLSLGDVYAQSTDNLNINGTLTIKQAPESPTGIDPLQLFLTIIIGGSIVAGTYEWIRQYLSRRREEFIDISKKKMDVIEKSAPLLNQLGTYCYTIHSQLKLPPNQRNKEECLYYYCNLSFIQNVIFTKYGGLQLGSLLAESVVIDFVNYILLFMKDGLGYETMHRMRTMTNDTPNFYKFKNSVLPFHPDLVQKFSLWLDNIPSEHEMTYKTLWFYHLIDIEINHIYHLWYNRPPDGIKNLDETGLISYLKNNIDENPEYADYLDRLGGMESGRLWKLKNTR